MKKLYLGFWIFSLGLPLGCAAEEPSPVRGSGGAAGAACTYQSMGATDPMPVPLECDAMEVDTFTYRAPQLCVGTTHAAFLAGHCNSAACIDRGNWKSLAATVGADFGAVVSAIPIGCDRLGVEVILELAPNATSGELTLAGTVEGFEPCHGASVSCPLAAISYALDVSASDCADTGRWYCHGVEAASQLDLVLGAGGAGGTAP